MRECSGGKAPKPWGFLTHINPRWPPLVTAAVESGTPATRTLWLPRNHCFNYFRNLKSGIWITSFRVWQGKKATGEITHLEPRGGQLTAWPEV